MVVVYYLIMAWLSIFLFSIIQHKLPLGVNFLLFMVVEIVVTNKLSYLIFSLQVFKVNEKLSYFLSLILHNDFTITFILLAAVNGYWSSERFWGRAFFLAYGIAAQLATGYALRRTGVLVDLHWNYWFELVMAAVLLILVLLFARLFRRMASTEGWAR